jgi:RHS repeat-associated protein
VVGGATTEFLFNANGQRVSVWNGSNNTQIQGQYYWGSKPVAYYKGGDTHFQHQDWMGTERMRTAYNGSVEGTFTSLPFGDAQTTASGSDTDAYHFPMLDSDAESDTDHAQYRQYNSTQGRWMRPDPYRGSYDIYNPQSFNRYAYVKNNPLSRIDPSGLEDEDGCPDGETCVWSGDGGDGGGDGGGAGDDNDPVSSPDPPAPDPPVPTTPDLTVTGWACYFCILNEFVTEAGPDNGIPLLGLWQMTLISTPVAAPNNVPGTSAPQTSKFHKNLCAYLGFVQKTDHRISVYAGVFTAGAVVSIGLTAGWDAPAAAPTAAVGGLVTAGAELGSLTAEDAKGWAGCSVSD